MKPDEIFFRDVTGDPEAAQQVAQRGPELRAALLTCGFTPVGLAEFRAPGLAPQLEMLAATNPDAELVQDAVANGEVDEVMTAPNRRALAAVENAFGGPVVSLRTLLEDGRIVETTMKPVRPPQNLDPFGTMLTGNTHSTNLPLQATAKLMQLGTGKLPLWPRGDWPRAGYQVELVDTRDVSLLWQRHQQRLADSGQSQSAEIRPHTTLPLYFCFSCRTNEVQAHHAKWIGYFNRAVLVLFLLALPLTLIVMQLLADALKPLKAASGGTVLLILAPILFMLGVAVAAMLLMGLSRTILSPQIRGPRLRSVLDLLAEVQQRMTATPPPPPVLTERQQKALADLKRIQERFQPASSSRVRTTLQLILVGAMLGILTSGRPQATTVDALLGILGLNLVVGALAASFWSSGLSLKAKLAAGALTGGLLTLSHHLALYQLLGRTGSIIVAGVLGVILWSAIYWLLQRRIGKLQ